MSAEEQTVELAAKVICNNWPRDPDGCAARCMDRLGSIPKNGCKYAVDVHGKMAREIIAVIKIGTSQ